jgi:hypothetical protein
MIRAFVLPRALGHGIGSHGSEGNSASPKTMRRHDSQTRPVNDSCIRAGSSSGRLALLPHRASIVPVHGRLPAPNLAASDAPDRRQSVGATFVTP